MRKTSLPDTPKAPIKSLRYLFSYLAPYKLMVVLALGALLVTSSSVLGLGYALRYLVDEGISKGDTALLDRSYAVLMAVIVLLALTTFARYFFVTWIGERVVADIRRDMYGHLIAMDVTFYETRQTGELLSRLTTDTTLIQTVVGSSVSIALRNALLLLGGVIMLCVTSLQLTSYVMLIVPLVVVPIVILGKKVRILSRQTQDRIADINSHAEETIYAIQTIQAFTLEDRQQARFDEYVKDSLSIAAKRIKMRAVLTAIVITLVLGAIATVLWFGGRSVIEGTISVGELSSFVFYAMVVAGATGAISEVIGELQRAAGAVERLAELKTLHPVIASPVQPVSFPDTPVGTIAFDNVSFYYPSRPDQAALSNITLTIKRGQTVALVGSSGGGKTTVFRMLLRYYDPADGCILMENIPLSSLSLHTLRQRIAVVSQDPIIFSTSAFENIMLGNPSATKEQVMEAAKHAEIYDFLQSLPEGFDSHLGEKGIRLSGGQKQRIAIARAIIRAPDILLLDEATSALDSDNEQKVQQALEHAMQGRTTLVIAHRLATVRNADHIIVMDEGKVQAQGTHESLMRDSELYQVLARQQFREA